MKKTDRLVASMATYCYANVEAASEDAIAAARDDDEMSGLWREVQGG